MKSQGNEGFAAAAPKIRLAKPDVGEEELRAVKAALLSGVLTNGAHTAAFEDAMAHRHQVKHAVAFANGTVALSAMYLALGIGPGDEVLVPSITFISSATSLLHVGAQPVFAEIEAGTFNIDPADIQSRITRRTRAILAVHYGGQPADLAELNAVASEAGLLLLEDAAEAHGASYRGRPVGGFGKAAMFSFTPTKNVTTGEGGVVTTNDEALATKLRLLRNHGQTRLYHHEVVGYNWRITEMQAAMGAVQVKKLDQILERKRSNAAYLRRLLVDEPRIELPAVRSDRTHTYMLFTLKLSTGSRDHVMNSLIAEGIEARLYFPPAHLQPIFRNMPVSLPRTERLAEQMLSVPFHSLLTESEIETIAAALKRALA